MARLAHVEVFAGDEIAIVHVMNWAVPRPVTNRDGLKDNAATRRRGADIRIRESSSDAFSVAWTFMSEI